MNSDEMVLRGYRAVHSGPCLIEKDCLSYSKKYAIEISERQFTTMYLESHTN